jgi:hypothetical protein
LPVKYEYVKIKLKKKAKQEKTKCKNKLGKRMPTTKRPSPIRARASESKKAKSEGAKSGKHCASLKIKSWILMAAFE